MSKYVHISQFDPAKNEGGVAQFALHLRSAIPELKFLHHGELGRPWEAVERINHKFDAGGEIDSDTTVIADGYYGLGLQGVNCLIVVCHSTYAGWMRDAMVNPLPALDKSLPWLMKAARAQELAYRQADEIVSVSESAAGELWDFYRLESRVIRIGVDTEMYHPTEPREDVVPGSVVEVAGNDINKGADIVHQLLTRGGRQIENLGFKRGKYDRWRPWEIALLPSRHEAGSYALLEAMSMDKKVVTYKSGLAKFEIPQRYLWATDDYYWGTFDRLLSEAVASDGRSPREWVLSNATLTMFQDKWREFLK